MLKLSNLDILESKDALKAIPQGKKLINTINAHSFNTAQKDELFAEALKNGDYLIPDGASIVKACKWLKCKSQPKERVAGWDLFEFEMNRLNKKKWKVYVHGQFAEGIVADCGKCQNCLSEYRSHDIFASLQA